MRTKLPLASACFAVAVLFALAPRSAAAAPPEGTAELDAPEPSPGAMRPREIDAKAILRTTPAVQYGGFGVSGDVGVAPIGPGTLAIGGSLAYETCGSTCWGAPLAFTQHQTWVEGRASYHLAPPRIGWLDVYPLVSLGVAFAGSHVRIGDTTEYAGSGIAPTVGFGGGASYFVTKHFFVSGEAMLRYAGGTYAYELERGPARSFDRSGVDGWSGATLALSLGAGVRL